MKPEYAQAILATIEANPQGFADACASVSPDDAEGLANETIDWLANEAGTTTEEPA